MKRPLIRLTVGRMGDGEAKTYGVDKLRAIERMPRYMNTVIRSDLDLIEYHFMVLASAPFERTTRKSSMCDIGMKSKTGDTRQNRAVVDAECGETWFRIFQTTGLAR